MSPEFIRIAYVSLFSLSIVACLGTVAYTRKIENPDTRRGLKALLILSAVWAAAQVGLLIAPDSAIAVASYTIGLIAGLATVGSWLYFCSAYAGRSYHTDPFYRRLALATYVSIVAFKLTNTWHGLYFEVTTATVPFQHTAVQEQAMFWIIAGLSYVLSAFGFYMLIDTFEQSRAPTLAARAVVILAILPVAFDLLGYLLPSPILALNYESVGVSLFAIGTLYVVREPFFAVSRYGRKQIIDQIDDAVLILDVENRVQDYNDAAVDIFPKLAQTETPKLETIANEIRTRVLADGGTVEITQDGKTRYLVIHTTPITVGATKVGYGIVCTDVTEIERQRRELQRKDEHLEGFATAITHELRNSVGIISGHAELLSRIASEHDDTAIQSRIETIVDEAEDMEDIIEQLQTLARYSQAIAETEFVDIDDAVRTAERQADTDDPNITVEDRFSIEADQERLRELLMQAVEFGAENGVSRVKIRSHSTGFSIEYDGQSLDDFDEEAVFAYGNATPNQDSAMRLPNLQMLATSHGWETEIVSESETETRIDITEAYVKPLEASS